MTDDPSLAEGAAEALLSRPLEWLLASGGDARLALDPVTRLNGYGCRPFPRPDAFTFASSTATSISSQAYAAAAGARQTLRRAAREVGLSQAFDDALERLRRDLLRSLGLAGTGCEIVLSPSGTDSQLHALYLARSLLGTPLLSMIAAADETGSGAGFATCGRNFSVTTAHGVPVGKSDAISGLAEGVMGTGVPLRDEAGNLRPHHIVDSDIVRGIERAVAAGRKVVLFAMDSSKFGQRAPSFDALRWIADSADGDVQIVIDACQTRLGRARLAWYLERGCMVLITGSKFFTGAPFSGALLIPAPLAERCAALTEVPAGLAAYTARNEWPRRFAQIRAGLPSDINLGLWLRWASALEEMRRYYEVPDDFRVEALALFATAVPRLIAAEPCLEPMTLAESVDMPDGEEFAAQTIFPFFVRRRGARMTTAEAMVIYRALNDDVTAMLPGTLPAMLRLLTARRCHIGQPVSVRGDAGGEAGALRISAGARVVSECWHEDSVVAEDWLRGEFEQIRAIIAKIALLVRYFDMIAPAYAKAAGSANHRVNAA
jgi:hypothetical protein